MSRAVILFTRVPLPGKTKTRLLPRLSPEQCARLHSAFLRDIAHTCAQLPRCRLLLCRAPEGDPAVLTQLLPGLPPPLLQQGETLGERMDHALRQGLASGPQSCLLIGADLPEVSIGHLEEAFRLLEDNDAVLGPTDDGGYYLVGVRRPQPALFRVSGYGGSTVLEQTLSAAASAGLRCALAPPCADVDEPADLDALARRLAGRPGQCPHTRRLLAEWGLLKEG